VVNSTSCPPGRRLGHQRCVARTGGAPLAGGLLLSGDGVDRRAASTHAPVAKSSSARLLSSKSSTTSTPPSPSQRDAVGLGGAIHATTRRRSTPPSPGLTSVWSSRTPSSPPCPIALRRDEGVGFRRELGSLACVSSRTSSPSTWREPVLLRSRGFRAASRRVADAMAPCNARGRQSLRQPSAARDARRAVEEARDEVRAFVGRSPRRHLHGVAPSPVTSPSRA